MGEFSWDFSSIRNIDNMKTIIAFFALFALAASARLEWPEDAIDEVMEWAEDSLLDERDGEFCYNLAAKDDCLKVNEKGRCNKFKAKKYCAEYCGHCQDDVCKDIQPTEKCQVRKDEGRCGDDKYTNILCPLTCEICTPKKLRSIFVLGIIPSTV